MNTHKHLLPRTLVAVFLLCLASPLWAASLTVEPGRNSIAITDQLNVNVTLKDGNTNDEPNFAVLRDDFDILNINRRVQSISVNGRSESSIIWQLALAPKRRGDIIIPSLEAAGILSEPVTITVTNAPDSPADTDAETFLQVTADKNSAYVQEQVLVSAKLYSKYNWTGRELGNFELDNALVEAVSEDEYVTTINGTEHLVYEVVFAFYPQKSGTLHIPPLQYAAQLRSGGRSLMSFSSGPVRRGRSQPIDIKVKPIPAASGADTWLPAQDIKLTQHFSHDPETLVAGEPVTRRVTIEAKGLLPTQLPPIEFGDIEGFSSYKDKAQTDQQRSDTGVSSTRTETLALVPNAAGRTTLPPVELRWFNTQTGEFETATLPALEVNATLPSTPGKAVNVAQEPETSGGSGKVTVVHRAPMWLIITQAVTGLLLLIVASLYFFVPKKRKSKTVPAGAPSDKALWKQVKRSAADQHWPQLRQDLLQWASVHWNTSVKGLDQLARLAQNPEIAEQLHELDKANYSAQNHSFDPGKLLPALQKLRVDKRDGKTQPLAPLYPTGNP
ncbi:BatD family protein [Gilvimarinus xylanilyticus]|uniref:BatD family protein n=1 Tax=Gilvimarinus xylanilyticus TaxID=2944139 RepID=A0A9X2HY86_9GAMM|nr:BatD family protein [Gilvimarinus xylanilyticus]MCP8898696.1 BatD family protein [Gilvimarinus xylanilyticus]